MKVSELKSILNKLDDNASLFVRNNETFTNLEIQTAVTDNESIVILPVEVK